MGKKFYASYTVEYDPDQIIKDMLDTGEHTLPIDIEDVREFVLDQFIYGLDGRYDASKPLDVSRVNHTSFSYGDAKLDSVETIWTKTQEGV